MRKVLNNFTYILYSCFCFGVAGYAFYYLLQPLEPNNGFQMKMFNSGAHVPMHFIASGIALFLIPLQLSKKLRRYSIQTHKRIGKVYAFAVLLGGLSGLIMAFNASGGLYAKMGFTLLSLAWLYTSFFAIKYALVGRIAQHKRWIYRSMAVTSAAITLRLFLGIGLGVFHLPFFTVYVPASWLCWILNLIVCELILIKKQSNFRVNAVA